MGKEFRAEGCHFWKQRTATTLMKVLHHFAKERESHELRDLVSLLGCLVFVATQSLTLSKTS